MKLRFNKEIVTVVVLLVSVAVILGVRWAKGYYQKKQRVVVTDKKAKGNPEAPIQVIEYTDFLCPACAGGANALKKFMDVYPDQIFLVYRHFPLPQLHPYAITAAIHAECAAEQDTFWPYHDYLFENAKLITHSISPRRKLMDKAKELQLDMDKFEACVESPDAELAVLNDKSSGRELGARATPTYFVNGEMIVGSGNIKTKLTTILDIKTNEEN